MALFNDIKVSGIVAFAKQKLTGFQYPDLRYLLSQSFELLLRKTTEKRLVFYEMDLRLVHEGIRHPPLMVVILSSLAVISPLLFLQHLFLQHLFLQHRKYRQIPNSNHTDHPVDQRNTKQIFLV